MSPSRSILICVALATTLDIISFSAGGYLQEQAFTQIPMDQFGKPISNTTVAGNVTVPSNSTLPQPEPVDSKGKHSYGFRLTRELFVAVIANTVLYYWNIWLERTFPIRSKAFAAATVRDQGDKDEQVEEEIIQKWMAQGKIKRASVNWGNTFIKWALQMTLGCLLQCAIQELIEELVAFREGKFFDITLYNLAVNIILGAVFSWFTILPLASLVGFVVVPAPKRVVYQSGISCLWNIFIGAFLGIAIPWLHRIAIMAQEMDANATTNGTMAKVDEL